MIVLDLALDRHMVDVTRLWKEEMDEHLLTTVDRHGKEVVVIRMIGGVDLLLGVTMTTVAMIVDESLVWLNG